MKKLLILGLVVLVLMFAVGCSSEKESIQVGTPGDEVVVEPAAPSEPEPAEAVDIPAAPAAVEEDKPATKLISKQVKALLEKADTKITSYRYYYPVPPSNQGGEVYTIKGSKMKLNLYKEIQYEDQWIDTVYLDTDSKTGVAYCELTTQRRCADPDKEVPVIYSDFFRKTPYQWIKEVTFAVRYGGEQIGGRDASILTFEKDGKEFKMWVDEFHGLPLRVEFEENGELMSHQFRDMQTNNVKDEELEHPVGGRRDTH